MILTNPNGPNTTVLLPGSCNASCNFCFWNRDEAKIAIPSNYLDRVFGELALLPKEFQTLSISGGEPTLSPYFGRFLSRLGVYRRTMGLERVVLTTHAGNLANHLHLVGSVVEHINISRHAIGTFENENIFKTKQIPSDEELTKLIRRIHDETACDVTINCVIPVDATVSFCEEFIDYTKNILGADAVSFRKIASNTAPTSAENTFRLKHGVLGESKCPVCRGMTQIVDGFPVRWKGSVAEPSIQTKGVYEAVIHPDGVAYADWSMSVPLNLANLTTVFDDVKKLDDQLGTTADNILERIKARARLDRKKTSGNLRAGCGGTDFTTESGLDSIEPDSNIEFAPSLVANSDCGSSGCGSTFAGCGSLRSHSCGSSRC